MRLPGEYLYVMENHSAALRVWESHNVHNACCVHLDAHLDIGWLSKEGVKLMGRQGKDLGRLRERDCFLHTQEGHFDIASWLSVAISAGMLSELFWVVPNEVWFDSPLLLQKLLSYQVGDIDRTSFIYLRQHEEPYRFTIGMTDIVVCRLGQLPPLKRGRILLDIDLDYFSRYREPGNGGDWSEPSIEPSVVVADLHTQVSHAEVTTVSVSWNGGYMPNNLLPKVLPICNGAENIQEREVWNELDYRHEGSYVEYTWACGLLHRKRPAEALQFARRAAELDPQIGAYHYAVSLSAAGVGDLVSAAEARDQCLSSGTVESAQVLNDFAGISARMGDFQNALALQEKAFAIDQAGSPIISANLMSLYAQAERWDCAQHLAQLTIERQPFNSEAFVVLAIAAQHHSDNMSAAEMWELAAEVSLDDRQKDSYRRRSVRLRLRRKDSNHA